MTEIRLFDNGEFQLEITPDGDSFTVQAPGLARALGFREAYDLVRSIPDGEKGSELLRTPGGEQRLWFLKEPGFYRSIGQRQAARVRKAAVREQVERFQTWVYAEVLPSIRRTGGYQIPQQRKPVEPFGYHIEPPNNFTYDEACGLLRQYYGVSLGVNELTRYLRHAGILKQNGAPTKKYAHLFWFTGTSWNVQSHLIPQFAWRVCEAGREMQDWRFLQGRLELEGVGRPTEGSPPHRQLAP